MNHAKAVWRRGLLLGALLLIFWSGTSGASPLITLRTGPVLNVAEVELHVEKWGFLLTVWEDLSANACTGWATSTGVRYSPTWPEDSWYFGFATTSTSGAPAGCNTAIDGTTPMVGRQWIWKDGLSLDIGLRPALVTIGFGW